MPVVVALLIVVAMIVFVGLLFSLPVMWLWNSCLVGAVSGVSEIGWLQAWGIMILCGLLFKDTSVSNKKD